MTHSARRFRSELALRILQAAALGALAAAGCSEESTDPSGAGASGGDGAGAAGAGGPSTRCFDWPQDTEGPGGRAGGAGGAAGGAGGSGGTIGSAGGSGGAVIGGATGEGGAPTPTCPSKSDAYRYFLNSCGAMVMSEGTYEDGQCCYQVQTTDCVTGRPLRVDGASLVAPLAEVDAAMWSSGTRPQRQALSPPERQALAQAWARDALMEHASVAAFARVSLELLAFGAPADLVAATHRAALDEVRHAELCFALASGYAGRDVGPGSLPLGQSVRLATDLASLAAATVVEGCVGETLSALVAAAQLETARDPAVRAALLVISRDEARHAELAWRTVAWAIRAGGAPVRKAVERAFAEATASAPRPATLPAAHEEGLRAYGRLPAVELLEELERGLTEVVMPAARRLLDDRRDAPGAAAPAGVV